MCGLTKLAMLEGDKHVPLNYKKEYKFEALDGGIKRLVVALPLELKDILVDFFKSISGPYFVLYVLHTSRGEGDNGRYQSPALTAQDLDDFLSKYIDYLTLDSRFDLWVHSPNTGATFVYDRHSILYCYGPEEPYQKVLERYSFSEGKPTLDFPHVHYYHSELDLMAKNILSEYDWSWAPLQAQDEQ
jgi:hypothetical protein